MKIMAHLIAASGNPWGDAHHRGMVFALVPRGMKNMA